MEMAKDRDNRLSSESSDSQLCQKELCRLFDGCGKNRSNDEYNALIAKKNTLTRYIEAMEDCEKRHQATLTSIVDQIEKMNQKIPNSINQTIDPETTSVKQFSGSVEVCNDCKEKCDQEKNIGNAMLELECNDDKVSFKEDLEMSEKAFSCGSVTLSEDSNYVSIASSDVGFTTDEESNEYDSLGKDNDVFLKEDSEALEKESTSISSLEFDSNFNNEEPLAGVGGLKESMDNQQEFSSECFSSNGANIAPDNIVFSLDEKSNKQDCLAKGNDVLLKEDFEALEKDVTSISSLFDSNFNTEEPLAGVEDLKKFMDNQQGFGEYLLGIPLRFDGRMDQCWLDNELSLASKREEFGEILELNILMSFLSSGTSSFNQYNTGKDYDAATNMMYCNFEDKEFSKKSPQSMFNQYSSSFGIKCEETDGFDSHMSQHPADLSNMFAETDDPKPAGQDGPSILGNRFEFDPRKRSGSCNKSKGRRHHSKRHGNTRGGLSGGGRNDGCGGADNSTQSLGSNGDGGGGGDGNDDEDDKKRKAIVGKNSNDEEEEDEGESDDDNKEGTDEKEAEESGNLLPAAASVQDKTMDKDLTFLLGHNLPVDPSQPTEPKGQAESESVILGSALQRQIQQGHSCVSLNTFCDILGAASGEDYVPKDDPFMLLNACLTHLIHNLSLASGGLDCHHCLTLSGQLKHLAKCEEKTCIVCVQGNNLILHHVKICISRNNRCAPLNRMDLCFHLCQDVHWNCTQLFTSRSKTIIKKYCNKILTFPIAHELFSTTDRSLHGTEDEHPEDERPQTGEKTDKPDVRPKCQLTASKDSKLPLGQGSRRPSGGHSNLTRKPSTSRRSFIPPSIDEGEEEEEKRNGATTEESAEAILRKIYVQNTEEDTAKLIDSRENHVYSLPQRQIYDQTQFNSLVHGPIGVRGVGEVVYSNVAQLRLVADFWGQKKDEYKSTRKRPRQLAEEGVVLEKYKSQLKILGTRYQVDTQWVVLTDLGSGMSGRCYLAMDLKSEFRFCVKKINLLDYKKEELCLWADLEHSNIVKLFGALRHSDFVYMFAEYIDGGDLAHCIEEHKSRGERLSHWLALNYFQQLLKILLYLESKNVLHEDIKADNLLLRADTFQIVLTDFGLCHRLQKAVELKDKAPAGTVTHFSPEKAASMGHGFPACVWACVCVLVQMLSGQQPWQKYLKKVDYLNFTIYMKPPPLEDLPDNIRAIVKDLIAKGFIKDPELRPNARQLLQHEAFNIINQEPETYLSVLASAFQTNVGGPSRSQREQASAAAATRPLPDDNEAVSLYEISLPPSAEKRLMSGIQKSANCDAHGKNDDALQVSRVEHIDACSDEELEGAVGGDIFTGNHKTKEMKQMQNVLISSTAGDNTLKDTNETEHYSDEVKALVDGTLPQLEYLLQTSDESTRSFLTDNTSTNLKMQVPLEVFVPDKNRTNNWDYNDCLPNLSIFDPYSWDKGLVSRNSSSDGIASSELFTPGAEDVASQPPENHMHFIQKKPSDLKLMVGNHPSLKQQDLQDKLNPSTSKKSCSTNTATASSQGSSVFFPDSASANVDHIHNDFPFAREEAEGEDSKGDAEEKTGKELILANLRQSINDDDFGAAGVKLTLYDENGKKLFSYLVQVKNENLPVKDHISAFKSK